MAKKTAGPGRGALKRAESRQALAFMSPALIGLSIFTVLPVGLSIVMSFYNWPTFGQKTFVGFDNYIQLFTRNPDFWPALRNSVVFTVLYVPANLVIALALALLLSERIKGRNIYRVLFFIPVVTPVVANALVWKMLLQPQGLFAATSTTLFGIQLPNFLADQNWAMISIVVMSIWQGLGYNMLIFSAAIEQLPAPVLEAAKVDGAKGMTMIRKIVLPMLSPSIFFCLVMTMITSLQVFAQPQMMTNGGPGNATLPLVMFIYKQGFTFHQLGIAAAGAWILFIIVILVTGLQFWGQKRWVHYEH